MNLPIHIILIAAAVNFETCGVFTCNMQESGCNSNSDLTTCAELTRSLKKVFFNIMGNIG